MLVNYKDYGNDITIANYISHDLIEKSLKNKWLIIGQIYNSSMVSKPIYIQL